MKAQQKQKQKEGLIKVPAKQQRRRQVVAAMALGIIIVFAFLVRSNTFYLEHWQGDQSHYIALAMKLDKFGLDHYNLRGVKIKFIKFEQSDRLRIVFVAPADDIAEKGDILKGLEHFGIDYYDMPLYYKAPAFAYALVLSHKLFARPKQPYSVGWASIQGYLRQVKPRIFIGAQFYAVIVPLFFSLGLAVLTFLIGSRLFSQRAGLYAAFMMAMNPVSILISQKLLADDMSAFFFALSALLFIVAMQLKGSALKENGLILLAGVSCGIAVLAKQTAGLLVVPLWIFTVVAHPKKIWNIECLPRIICNKKIILFLVGLFLVSAFWFLKVHETYGYFLKRGGSAAVDKTGWNAILRSRPNGWILFVLGLPYLCPPFIFVYCSVRKFIINFRDMLFKKTEEYRFVFLWLVILTFVYYFRGAAGQEERRMLPVYPFIAVVAGYCLDRFRLYSGRWRVFMPKPFVRELIIVAFFIASAIWSVPMAIEAAIDLKVLLMKPF